MTELVERLEVIDRVDAKVGRSSSVAAAIPAGMLVGMAVAQLAGETSWSGSTVTALMLPGSS